MLWLSLVEFVFRLSDPVHFFSICYHLQISIDSSYTSGAVVSLFSSFQQRRRIQYYRFPQVSSYQNVLVEFFVFPKKRMNKTNSFLS
mmetsp:Transcript_20613/g.40822  ORF Transcript_20613/g.40822 Transcript_20613/m.40822 type:complete len:87 (-) Transcript_20613:70-330(-)